MLRFASSGELNIADLRVALFNYIVAKQRGDNMIVRIKDTDPQNTTEDADKEVAGLLTLFGIEYQNVLLQSSHLRYYRAFAIQMLHEKRAFNCFCTAEELEKKRQQALKHNKPFRYDNTCTNLPPEQTIDNENPFTVRLHHPDTPIVINDIIKGEMTYTPDEVDSFVLLDAKKLPTNIFAGAIDDMLSDISLVIRDDTCMEQTPGQIAMRHAIGYGKEIEYAHLPAMPNGHDVSVKSLLEDGYMPSAIANYLLLISCDNAPKKVFTTEEALEWFSLSNIAKSPEPFDIEKLKEINREHLKQMNAKELSRYVGFADDDIGNLARVFLDETATLQELRTKIEPVFAEKTIPDAYTDTAQKIKDAVKDAPYFATYGELKAYLLEQSGVNEDDFDTPFRLLLTGSEEGPDLSLIYPHLKNYLGEIIK